MANVEAIENVDSLVEWLQQQKVERRQVFPQGAGTRSIAPVDSPTTAACSLSPMAGITAYASSEYLISALAGTRIRDIDTELRRNGQFLPFDTSVLSDNATLGGTIGAGISGPRRQLYGSLRDFLMEVRLVDGLCNPICGGGRVVKNAAGFDLPKLMVGSLGRLGIVTEATLKVFPRPAQWRSLEMEVANMLDAITVAQAITARPLPIAGIAFRGTGKTRQVLIGIAGPAGSLDAVAVRLVEAANSTGKMLSSNHAANEDTWRELTDFAKQDGIIRTVQKPREAVALDAFCGSIGVEAQYWAGGEVAWIDAGLHTETLSEFANEASIPAMRLPVSADASYRLGDSSWAPTAERLRKAIDPDNLFLAY